MKINIFNRHRSNVCVKTDEEKPQQNTFKYDLKGVNLGNPVFFLPT